MSESAQLRTAREDARDDAPKEYKKDTQKLIQVAWTAYKTGKDPSDIWSEVVGDE